RAVLYERARHPQPPARRRASRLVSALDRRHVEQGGAERGSRDRSGAAARASRGCCGSLDTAHRVARSGALCRNARLHDDKWRAAIVALRADARPCLQPRDASSRPDHRRDHGDGLPLPRDRSGLDAASRKQGTAAMTNILRIERSGPVARVWLDRPEVRNALNGALIRELAAAFASLSAEGTEVRAIVLGGSGKAFCAGADLAFMREVGSYTWEQNRADAEVLAEMLWTMYRCPIPVIARIHGDCYAGGLGLASVCDIRIVADVATFCLSEARLGLLPATISPYVVRAMGEQAAKRYFVTAERFGAAEAKAMGLAHEVCAPEALDAKVY